MRSCELPSLIEPFFDLPLIGALNLRIKGGEENVNCFLLKLITFFSLSVKEINNKSHKIQQFHSKCKLNN